MTLRWHPAGGQRRLTALVAARVRERLHGRPLQALGPAERRLRVREEAMNVLRDHRVVLGARDLTRLVNEVSDEVVGVGAIEFLLKDPDVTEVMVNGPDDVYVERKGPVSCLFVDAMLGFSCEGGWVHPAEQARRALDLSRTPARGHPQTVR